jgi:hypothetical protein
MKEIYYSFPLTGLEISIDKKDRKFISISNIDGIFNDKQYDLIVKLVLSFIGEDCELVSEDEIFFMRFIFDELITNAINSPLATAVSNEADRLDIIDYSVNSFLKNNSFAEKGRVVIYKELVNDGKKIHYDFNNYARYSFNDIILIDLKLKKLNNFKHYGLDENVVGFFKALLNHEMIIIEAHDPENTLLRLDFSNFLDKKAAYLPFTEVAIDFNRNTISIHNVIYHLNKRLMKFIRIVLKEKSRTGNGGRGLFSVKGILEKEFDGGILFSWKPKEVINGIKYGEYSFYIDMRRPGAYKVDDEDENENENEKTSDMIKA